MRLIAVILSLIVTITIVNGHAVLKSPVAWNPSPSKGSPCGAGTPFTSAAGSIVAGQNNSFTWQVVAGDGNGPVTVSIDTAGGTSFTLLQVAATKIPSVGTYTLTIFVPAGTTCTGGLCTLQFKSSTAWYSCTTVNIASASTSTGTSSTSSSSSTGVSSTCYTAPNTLAFCTAVRGVSIDFADNMQLKPTAVLAWDVTVNSTYNQNLKSALVFTHQHNTACYTAYKKWLCADSFPVCGTGTTGTCSSNLLAFSTACGINATHQELFEPADNTRTTFDSTGTCTSTTTSSSTGINGVTSRASVSFAIIGMVAMIAAIFRA